MTDPIKAALGVAADAMFMEAAPDEARKKALLAAATRMRDACQWGGPPEDWLLDAERILDQDFADLIAARVAEARAKALEEAAAVVEQEAAKAGLCSARVQHAATLIRALKEATHD